MINSKNVKYFQNSKNIRILDDKISLNNSDRDFWKLKTKEIYFHCLYPIKKPKCIEAWESILHCEISWKDVCKIINKSIQGNKQKQLHWKIIQRALYSEVRLEKIGKSTNKTLILTLVLVIFLCFVIEENLKFLIFYKIRFCENQRHYRSNTRALTRAWRDPSSPSTRSKPSVK